MTRVPYITRLEIWSASGHGSPRRVPAIGFQAKSARLGFSKFFNARRFGGIRRARAAAERYVTRELRARGVRVGASALGEDA